MHPVSGGGLGLIPRGLRLAACRVDLAYGLLKSRWLPGVRRIPAGPFGAAAGGDRVEQERMMNKIAVTSEGPSLDDLVDPRFGRAAGFLVVDLDTMNTQYIDNGSSQAMAQGAGIQAAEVVARAGVSCLLTGFVGPKAFQALSAAGIKVVQNLDGLTVRQAVERFQSGQVEMASQPNRMRR